MAEEELVLLARDDKTVSLVVIPATPMPSPPASEADAAAAAAPLRPYGGALAREGGPSDGTLLLSGFEARADGPELGDQHELTSRDLRRLVRLAVNGGDMDGDEGYQRAVDGGAPVSRDTRAVMLDQGLRSARHQTEQQQQQPPESTRGMPPRMRTGLW